MWDSEDEIAELKLEDLAERRHGLRLLAHPDCRDPEHPGCAYCREEQDYVQVDSAD